MVFGISTLHYSYKVQLIGKISRNNPKPSPFNRAGGINNCFCNNASSITTLKALLWATAAIAAGW